MNPLIQTVDFERKAHEQLCKNIRRSECSICNTANTDCIEIDTVKGKKAVCLVCSNAIILKCMELYEIYKPTQDEPTQETHKHKPTVPKVKVQTNAEELIQHQYYEMLDFGVPILEIAIVLKIPIETLQKYIEKWEEEDRIKENKELQDTN